MAYQIRQKDPLLDSTMQAALSRRSRELIGFALLFAAVCLALMLASYSPDDPTIQAATEIEPRNYLGRFGATVSMILLMVSGAAVWALAIALAVWGARLLTHRGADRALGRGLFVVPWVAVCAVYASTHVPPETWGQESIGLGGLLGDTTLGLLLSILPVGNIFGLKLLALILFAAVILLGAFCLGMDRAEVRAMRVFLLGGLVTVWAGMRGVSAVAGQGAGRAASALRERRAAQPVQDTMSPFEADTQDWTPEPLHVPTAAPEPQSEPRLGGILGRLSRKPEPAQAPTETPVQVAEPEDRVKARIASAIQGRVKRGEPIAPPSNNVERPPVPTTPPPEPVFERPATPEPQAEAPIVAPVAPKPRMSFVAPRREAPAPDPAPQPRVEPSLSAPRSEPPLTLRAPAPFEDLVDDADDPYADPGYEPLPEPDDTAVIPTPTVVASPPLTRAKVQHPKRTAPKPSRQAMAEAQPRLRFEEPSDTGYEIPPLSLLSDPSTIKRHHLSDEALEENARMLETVLDDYGVKGEIVSVRPGPVVTMYELEPAPGLKASRVIGLADDIARSMSALSARVSTVPGRSVIGIELPNEHREMVVLREMLAHSDFGDSNSRLPLALGKDIGGAPVIANLAKMPHLLIAGTTGSGKSVAINTMILSLLYKLTPEECRLIMIDPKMLELSVYDGIPHLLSPVVTDPKKAVVALKWTVGEMEERYRKMSKMGVRNIDGYNARVQDALDKGEMFSRTVQTGFDDGTGEPVFETEEIAPVKLPYIVVIVDEMADLMMVAGKEIEACIQRLAQMARASGIHLVMATQRPSVDVITGTIKANFPTRISFHVTSKIDSRTILGEQGAEQLLGMGDMLFMAGGSKITRVHGPFCSDEEVEEIVNHLKSFGPPEYASAVLDGPDDEKASSIDEVLGLGGNTDGKDALYDQAVAIVAKDRKCSTSYIQRKLGIGYNKAARLVEQMEDNGLVTPANHVGKRDILLPEVVE